MDTKASASFIHRLTIAPLVSALRNTDSIMAKAEAHATTNGIALETYEQARLHPDMFTFLQQVQYVCYLAVDFARHFSDAPPPRVGYDEASWTELRQSLSTAASYVEGVAPERVDRDAGKILPTFMDDTRGMGTIDYAAAVIVPDVHFHMVVAYALLRHQGVPLGKADFLGNLDTVALNA